jgi:uncharacterized membrane protein YsdA (DUF1294 family)
MMPDNILLFICGYLAAINLVAMVVTIYDKRAAKRGSPRIMERTLLFLSFLGGSVAMFMTMNIIRHKTKHAKFMVGIPVIIIVQLTTVVFVCWLIKR